MDLEATLLLALGKWPQHPGFVGAYITGSSTRPYADAESDLDVVVVVEDAVSAGLDIDQRYTMGLEHGPPPRKIYDLMVCAFSTLVAHARCDVDHYRHAFRSVRVVADPSGRIAAEVRLGAELPNAIRDERLRVHYYEHIWQQKKALTAQRRGYEVNARMTRARCLEALAKCLFLAEGSWVAKAEWTMQELRLLGVPEPILDGLEQEWRRLEDGVAPALGKQVGEWLDQKGHRFHRNTVALTNWAAVDPAGVGAVRRWARGF